MQKKLLKPKEVDQWFKKEASWNSLDGAYNTKNRPNTGMSGMMDDDEDSDEYNPVYIPEDFKKPRSEKLDDQSRVLKRLQNLM